MERAFGMMTDHPFAAVAGLAAMICYASWPLCRTRSAILTTYISNNLGFMLHYALLGQWTAVAMNGILAVQTVVAMHLDTKPWLRWLYLALIPVLAFGSWSTWHGMPSLLAGAAATLSTLGRMQINETSLRLWLLTSAPFWMAHDVIVGSLPGQLADILSMASGGVMIGRRSPAIINLVRKAFRGHRPVGRLRYSAGR
jgi:hypothetical protein